MRLPLPHVDPVAIAIDRLEAGGDVRFSGVDLDSGSRVTVSIDRSTTASAAGSDDLGAAGLVLVLTMHTMGAPR